MVYTLTHDHFSRGLGFDENLANIFNKVVCLTYRSGDSENLFKARLRFT